jgi:hypothetical protein
VAKTEVLIFAGSKECLVAQSSDFLGDTLPPEPPNPLDDGLPGG